MRRKALWTVGRFPSGFWSAGGKPTDPVYAECEIFQVMADSRESATKKAQGQRYRERKKHLSAQQGGTNVD